MQREQVLALTVAALALLAFGAVADSVGTAASRDGVDPPDDPSGGSDSITGSGPDSVDGGSDRVRPVVERVVPPLSPAVLAAIGLVAALAAGALYLRAGDSDDTVAPAGSGRTVEAPTVETDDGPAFDAPAVDPTNDVYRAWQSLTEAVDGGRGDARTPREYARAAREAGLPDDAVGTVTDLFRAVRYGDAEPTPELESDAADAADAFARPGDGGEAE